MDVRFDHIVPEPLSGSPALAKSQVWGHDLRLMPGETVLFRAASGKGKSTLLHILYGLRKDYQGEAYWMEKPLKRLGDADWSDLRSRPLSIVFQDLRLFLELTVADNLLLKNALSPETGTERIRAWLEELGLGHKWQQRAGTLSYGERQRVAIVRALIQPFQWLLLDEPFSHLDRENKEKAALLIRARAEELRAGALVVDLDDNDYFPYSRKLAL